MGEEAMHFDTNAILHTPYILHGGICAWNERRISVSANGRRILEGHNRCGCDTSKPRRHAPTPGNEMVGGFRECQIEAPPHKIEVL